MSPSKVTTIDFNSFHNIVDGKPRSSKTYYHGIDPSTKQNLWEVPVASKQDLDDAVSAAQRAFSSWSTTTIEERREKLKSFSELIQSHTDELTDLLVQEAGKPRLMAGGEVGVASKFISHHTKLDIPEEKFEDDEKEIYTRYIPMGVVGAICPWNFPILLAGKIAPALITGNCIIVKPSPYTPYTALKIAEIGQQVFPPGVLQVLGGDDKIGPWITMHPGIQKISFTGSIATGKKVAEACAKTLKRVTLELGGNDASIVLPDVDVQATAPSVAMGAFMNSGQVCVASKRIYVHESIYQDFLAAMSAFVTKTLKVGPGNETGVMIGPIQNEMQYEKVKGFFGDSAKQGHKFTVGGPVQKTDGYFIHPTIVDNPPNESRIITEEPFGPIVPVQPWTDEAEVIRRANETNTGLGACVWSKDVKHAREIAEQLQAGSVFINSFAKPVPEAFFSGHKESGVGGEWGPHGMLSYCNARAIHIYK
ncbi:MAG: hypothetical protein M1837_006419 [Sclerophora amabilis]|nr:MAG: hypothetical protein M1837_006419 [Sclerophora amabilis]